MKSCHRKGETGWERRLGAVRPLLQRTTPVQHRPPGLPSQPRMPEASIPPLQMHGIPCCGRKGRRPQAAPGVGNRFPPRRASGSGGLRPGPLPGDAQAQGGSNRQSCPPPIPRCLEFPWRPMGRRRRPSRRGATLPCPSSRRRPGPTGRPGTRPSRSGVWPTGHTSASAPARPAPSDAPPESTPEQTPACPPL